MTEIPFAFFKQHVTDFEIPGEGEYAVGLFFSKERILGSEHEAIFKKYFEGEGLSILGYRNVPVNKDAIAKHVADTMPVIQQVFIDIRTLKMLKSVCFSEKTIRVLFDSVRFRIVFYELITQNNCI